jgi:chemotaxis protein methyltransferase CheR
MSVSSDPGEISLSEVEFNRVKKRVYTIAGISLSDAKRTLVISRLTKHVKAHGLASFGDYLDFLDQRKNDALDQEFVNALTTNLTRFFREDHHFDHLANQVGQLIATRPRVNPNGKGRLRIWSAGCSTGQEPYTIALHLLSKFPELKRWDFRILATDIDTNVLARAASGTYPEQELAGLSRERAALFQRPGDGTIRIPAEARECIAFKPLNLMEDWPIKGPFDAIFCRNVVIYFDKPTQARIFSRLGKILSPDGYLYVGHSENAAYAESPYKLVGKTIYQMKPAQHLTRHVA